MAEVGILVGIISFGIQVCGGVLNYLGAVQKRQKELRDARDDVRILANLFQSLNGAIVRIHTQRPDDAALLLHGLTQAMTRLMELRDLVAKLAGVPPDEIAPLHSTSSSQIRKPAGGIWEKSKDAGRRTLYRFHQDDVKTLRQTVQNLAVALNLAVSITRLNEDEVQLQNIEGIKDQISTLDSDLESKTTGISSALKSLPSIIDLQDTVQENALKLDALQQHLSSDISSLDGRFSATERAVTNVGSQMVALEGGIRDAETSILTQIQFARREIANISNTIAKQQGRLAAERAAFRITNRVATGIPPASLQQACDTAFAPPSTTSNGITFPDVPQVALNVAPVGRICQCRAVSTTRFISLPRFKVFFRQRKLRCHAPNCPLYDFSQQYNARTVGARTHLRMGLFLSYLVEISFTYSTGAGGSSFSPSVRWKNVVPSKRCLVVKEFSIVNVWLRTGKKRRETQEVTERLKSMWEKIRMFYRDGRASVNDVNEDGINHLQNFINLLVDALDCEILGPEIIWTAMPMIQLYIELGLDLDQRHRQCNLVGFSPTAGFLPNVETSTTLAKSLGLLIQYKNHAIDQCAELISCIAKASDPAHEDVIKMMPYIDSNFFFTHILDYESSIDISPLARSIISRSLDGLKYHIDMSPDSMSQKTHGLTTVHLCIGWPQGLAELLKNSGKLLLDTPDDISETLDGRIGLAWPFSYAAAKHCVRSLDILLEAGCNLWPDKENFRSGGPHALSCALEATSEDCAEVFARHIVRRRRDLFTMVTDNIDRVRMPMSPDEEIVFDETIHVYNLLPTKDIWSSSVLSNYVISCLNRAGIPIPSSHGLPEYQDGSLYHLSGFPLRFFPIFSRHGLYGYNEPDVDGLLPVMEVWRSSYVAFWQTSFEENFKVLPWFIERGYLDAKPSEPTPRHDYIRLNTSITGWHYLSLIMVKYTWDYFVNGTWKVTRASQDLMVRIAEGEGRDHRDECLCWCTSAYVTQSGSEQGEKQKRGCSPFSFLCKQFFQANSPEGQPDNFQHHLFRHNFNDTSNDICDGKLPASTTIPTWQLEFLRALTFKALEIKHTCYQSHKFSGYRITIFKYPDPEGALQIRENPSEKGRALQLEELMAEFKDSLEQMTGSAQDFEKFIFGQWRKRIVSLYTVNTDETNEMERILDRVDTCVLPKPLLRFFGSKYLFFNSNRDLNGTGVPMCRICYEGNTDLRAKQR